MPKYIAGKTAPSDRYPEHFTRGGAIAACNRADAAILKHRKLLEAQAEQRTCDEQAKGLADFQRRRAALIARNPPEQQAQSAAVEVPISDEEQERRSAKSFAHHMSKNSDY